eukprot:1043797-Ditylum_brightwellii.AAC.1
MKKGHGPTLPIKHLAKQIEASVTTAANVNQPYTEEQVLSIVYTLVFKTGTHYAVDYVNDPKETTAAHMVYGANTVQQQGNLTEANLTLTKQLEKAQEESKNLKKKSTKKEADSINHFTPGLHTVYYCWSHGITVNANLTSQSHTRSKQVTKKRQH